MDYEASRVECMDVELGTRLRFENPSDAIFANLFLQEGGISWSSIDVLLSAIRDPSFNSRQVTFKDTSDFAARLAQIRERDLMRQRDAEQKSRLPEIIFEGAIDALGDELEHNLDLARKESHGYIPYHLHFNSFPGLLRGWRVTLINCALVHSTWLAPARRALGYRHHPNTEVLPRSVRSPWIGTWTKEVHLRIYNTSISVPTTIPLLRPLLARLPHIRRLQLTSHLNDFGTPNVDPGMLSRFFESLQPLTCLNELAFNVPEDPTSFIQILSSISLPNLRILRFLEIPLRNFVSLDFPPSFTPILSAFPSLCDIHFDLASKASPSQELLAVSWNKTANNSSVPSSQAEFFPFYARACVTNYPGSDDNPNWRRWRSSLPAIQRLYCLCHQIPYDPENSVALELKNIFALCTSLRSLSVLMDLPATGAAATMLHIPPTVEELEFTFSTLVEGLFEPFEGHSLPPIERWDADLAKALRSETSPRLHTFRAHFSRRTVDTFADDIYLDAHGKLFRKENIVEGDHVTEPSRERGSLLPRCQKICEDRCIQFTVEVLLLPWMS